MHIGSRWIWIQLIFDKEVSGIYELGALSFKKHVRACVLRILDKVEVHLVVDHMIELSLLINKRMLSDS